MEGRKRYPKIEWIVYKKQKNANGTFCSKGGVVLSFPPLSFNNFYPNRTKITSESIPKASNLAQGGTRKSTKIGNHKNNPNVNNPNNTLFVFLKFEVIFSKSEGSTAGRLLRFYEQSNNYVIYNITPNKT